MSNLIERLWTLVRCFWYGHDVPDEWLEYESECTAISIPCKRCSPTQETDDE